MYIQCILEIKERIVYDGARSNEGKVDMNMMEFMANNTLRRLA